MNKGDQGIGAIFDAKYMEVEKRVLLASEKLQKGLFSEAAFLMPKDEVIRINSDISKLSSDWSRLVPRTASQQHLQGNEKVIGIEERFLKLYTRCLEDFVKAINVQFKKSQNNSTTLLYQVAKHYHDYKAYSYWLYKIFYHIDISVASTESADLHSISLKTLKDKYFNQGQEKLLSTILDKLLESRQRQLHLDKQIKSLCELFIVMGSNSVKLKYEREQGMYDYICLNFQETESFYKDNFENKFLIDTQKYFRQQISEKSASLGIVEFVRWASKVFKLEESMCLECYPKSMNELTKLLTKLLVIEQAKRISDQGVQYLLSAGGIQQLGEIYDLISKDNDSINLIAEQFQIYQDAQARNVNSKHHDLLQQQQQQAQVNKLIQAETYCNQMLEAMDKANQIIQNQLDNNKKMLQAYQTAFSHPFNEINDSPFFLALYTDKLIRDEKGISEVETDKKLNRILQLFQLLFSKDKFLQHHQKFLQGRLINQLNKNLNLEKTLLQKFKGETQANIINSLQTMVNDIEQSHRFITDHNINKNQQYELIIYLLTQGNWPININQNANVEAPIELKKRLQNYEQIYLRKNNGRVLDWCFNLGQGELVYKIKTEKYYFNVSTLQIIVFLLFNQGDQFTIEEIQQRTKINKFDLENALIPFVCVKILEREKSDLDEFNDKSEVIKLNLSFNNRTKKMKIIPNSKMQPQRQGRGQELTKEEKEEEESLNKQREFVIDSQLVRIMKSKRTIAHLELGLQCQQMITIFKPDLKFIKKRIENLIEREYIKRDDKDWNIYHYLN